MASNRFCWLVALSIAGCATSSAAPAFLQVSPGHPVELRSAPPTDPVVEVRGAGTLFLLQAGHAQAVYVHRGNGTATVVIPARSLDYAQGSAFIGITVSPIPDNIARLLEGYLCVNCLPDLRCCPAP